MNNLFKKINLNYTNLEKDILNILDPEINYQIKFDSDNKDIIMLYNHDTKELLLTAKYNYIGIYNKRYKKWYWGWSLIKDKSTTKKSNLIKKLSDKDKLISSYTSSNNLNIEEKEIDNLIKIALYSMGDIWYFMQSIDKNLIQYISIEEILEKYI